MLTLIQGACAVLSYNLSKDVRAYCEWLDHWASFVLLLLVGAIHYLFVALIGIAVSIDALAIATTDTFSNLHAWIGVLIILAETFLITLFGLWVGHKLGSRYRYKSEFSGGILLIILAVKMLLFGVIRK